MYRIKKILTSLFKKYYSIPERNLSTKDKYNFDGNLTIGIVTFDLRFDKFFKPLIKKIKKYYPDIEIIISVNGAHNRDFDDKYRRQLLLFLAEFKNVYPIISPKFRSLSKLWNQCLIWSSNDTVLILNDDTDIEQNFLSEVIMNLKGGKTSFKINSSWSHVVLNRKQINKIGWFDERLLGIGEEDGDMEFRFKYLYGEDFKSIISSAFKNFEDNTSDPGVSKQKSNKYSLFNKRFINRKYKTNLIKGTYTNMFTTPKTKKINDQMQYPYEKYFWDNQKNL